MLLRGSIVVFLTLCVCCYMYALNAARLEEDEKIDTCHFHTCPLKMQLQLAASLTTNGRNRWKQLAWKM